MSERKGQSEFARWMGPLLDALRAQGEASREGVVAIELVDGERFVEFFEAKELGLCSTETFSVDHNFFAQFEK